MNIRLLLSSFVILVSSFRASGQQFALDYRAGTSGIFSQKTFGTSASKLLGTDASGNPIVYTLGTGLSFSGSTLNASGGGGGGGLDNIASTITGGTLTLSGTLTTGRILTVRDLAGTIALTTDLADYLTTSSAASAYQPLDADLTSIAALTTTPHGRSLLTGADAAATRSTLGLGTLATQNGNISDYLTTSSAAITYASLSGSYSDPAWITSLARTKLTGPIATVISSDTTLVSNRTYMLAMDGDTTLTLPASPSDGDVIIVNQSESTWTGMLTIARNGNTINGAASDLVYYSPGFGQGWWRATYLGAAATWQVSMVYDTVLAGMVYAPGSHDHNIGNIWSFNANRLYGTGSPFANGREITVGSGLNLSSGSLTVPANGITNTMLAGSIAASKLVGTDIATVGTITTGTWNGTTIAIANGGTGQTSQTAAFDALAPTTTKGDLIVHNGTDNVRLAGGADGHVLTRDSATAEGVKWAAASGGGGSATTDNRLYTADATWTNPSPSIPKRVFVRLVGGGGGGGSGRRGASGEVRCGGGGGAAAAVVEFWTLTTELGTTETVTVGAGGTGGASQTTNSTNGNAGAAGGDTLFNGGPPARGGGGGGGGTNAAGTAGTNATNATTIGVATANPSSGGAASGTGSTGAAGVTSVASLPTGGGAGGGITSANQAASGGNGGPIGNTPLGTLSGGPGGAWNGTLAGGTGNAGRGSGTGGGGGAGSTSGNAGVGGAGGGFGTGGGGGGSSTNDVGNSGAGGNGAPGYALIITYL